ncbi:SGNH/GDSL hydrolase family protein [Flavobacterium granuli]|uniref:Lysophospholipase L1 n=1 Tax=Flavobacterium granuli TaxID=280093 RepID=A0A1M5I7R6_9FLAO|nr:SGNH/GDSL hydrolase family protein [Flavobacterium granuli]PRZ27831.1 lysophospholipase L1-like esterase [Flavobacterium granuli]SHG24247.1 Lysophospholipase L1 [Flavobacterium granuli]
MNEDWPYLKKYQQENAELPLPKPDENRIVFMGDSITEFWSSIQPSFFLKQNCINRGISGQTTPQMLLRFRADVINLKPKLVVLLAGGNDIAGNTGPSTLKMIQNNLFSMIELAQVHHIKPILCSVLPANHFYWKPKEKPADTIIALNKSLRLYAETNSILFVDYYSQMVDQDKGLKVDYTDDGVHPNIKGYEIMAPLIEKTIELSLNKT